MMEVAEARKTLGISQEQLAELLQVTTRTVQNWEAGVSNPKPRQWQRINEWLTVFHDGMVIKNGEPQSDFSRLIAVIEEQQRTIARLTNIIERAGGYII